MECFDSGSEVQGCEGFWASGIWYRASGIWYRVSGIGFREDLGV
jgi:hypothetical protein